MVDDTVTLEPASASDADEIAAIHIASRADALPYLPRLHTAEQVRNWIACVVLRRCRVWVARENSGRAVGFLALDGDEVDQLYVLPGCQGQGIGSQLLDLAKKKAPGRLRLQTFQRNARARAFYEAQGFQAAAFSDGSRNEESEPDVRYEWEASPAA